MVGKFTFFEIAVLAVAILYPILMVVLAYLVRSDRKKLAELTHELIAPNQLDKETRSFVARMARDATDWKFLIGVAIIAPYSLTRSLFETSEPIIFRKPETALKFRQFMRLHMRSVCAANPLFAAIVAVEFAIAALLYLPSGALADFDEALSKLAKLCEKWIDTIVRRGEALRIV